MANDFSTDSRCKALWRFEDGALTTDSIGTNTLTAENTPTADTGDYKEGSACTDLERDSAQAFTITDANLQSGFPLKTGDATKKITVTVWFKIESAPSAYAAIIGKEQWGTSNSFLLRLNASNVLELLWMTSASGAQSFTFGTPSTGVWYHISIVMDGVNKIYRVVLYNDTTGATTYYSGTPSTAMSVGGCPFWIGREYTTGRTFDGKIDEVVIFNDLLNYNELYAIRAGTFTGPISWTGWRIDPINGDNTDVGVTWATAWKTFQHAFLAGDEIRIAKSTETALAGTVTATNGNEVIQTTNDLTGSVAQYTIVRIGTDDTIYMVWSRTSTTITLHRAYRGTTGSGKTISSVAGFTKTTTSDWIKSSGDGTSANPILVKGGYNTSTDVRDGFTVIEWAGTFNVIFNANHSRWQFSHVFANYTGGNVWATNIDCTFDYCGVFRNESYSPFGTLRRSTVNNFVCQYFGHDNSYESTINDLETGNPRYVAIDIGAWCLHTTYNRWINAGWYSSISAAINFEGGNISKVTFVDAVFDELGKGCAHFIVANYSSNFSDVNFYNPSLGSGVLFKQYSLSYNFVGEIGLHYVNGDPTDNRRIIALGTNNPMANLYPGVLQSDNSVYRTSPPSAKLTLNQWTVPYKITHCVPCDADISLTISAYLRKNSSYGSSNLPYMQLNWYTSSPPGLSFCTYDVAMSDVNDTWSLVSHTLTPGVTGTIGLEFVFQSSLSGALAWYDDISVS